MNDRNSLPEIISDTPTEESFKRILDCHLISTVGFCFSYCDGDDPWRNAASQSLASSLYRIGIDETDKGLLFCSLLTSGSHVAYLSLANADLSSPLHITLSLNGSFHLSLEVLPVFLSISLYFALILPLFSVNGLCTNFCSPQKIPPRNILFIRIIHLPSQLTHG